MHLTYAHLKQFTVYKGKEFVSEYIKYFEHPLIFYAHLYYYYFFMFTQNPYFDLKTDFI